jgi:hypothetical protein
MRLRVLAFAIVAAAGCAGSSSAPRPGTPPQAVGGLYLCLPVAPVAIYHGRFYPTNFPSPPPKTSRPQRCFASAERASAAGYHQAATPRGDLLIRGVYLVRPARSLTALCAAAAHASGLAVPCPTLIPGTPDDAFCAVGAVCSQAGAVVLEGTFTAPPTYQGAEPGQGHLWVIAYDRRSGVFPRDTLAGGTRVGTARIRHHTATFLAFPRGSSLNSGHIVLLWRQQGVTYAVSLHGHTALNQRLDLLIAQHLRFVSR